MSDPIEESNKSTSCSGDQNSKTSDPERGSSSQKLDSPKTQFKINLKEEVEREESLTESAEYVQPHSVCLKISEYDVDLTQSNCGEANPYLRDMSTATKDTKDKAKNEETRSIRSAKAVKKGKGLKARSTSKMTLSKKDAESSFAKNPHFADLDIVEVTLTPRSFLAKQVYNEGLYLLKTLYTFQIDNQMLFSETLSGWSSSTSSIFPMVDYRPDLYQSIYNLTIRLRKAICLPVESARNAFDLTISYQKKTFSTLSQPFTGNKGVFKPEMLTKLIYISFIKKIILEQVYEKHRVLSSTLSQYISTYTIVEEGNQALFCNLLTISLALRLQFQKLMDLIETFYYVQHCADQVKQKKDQKPKKKTKDLADTLGLKSPREGALTKSEPSSTKIKKLTKIDADEFKHEFGSVDDRFRNGTVHNIVARLTGLPDSEFQDVILFSYSAVIQPRDLWESMRDRYLTLSELEDKTGEIRIFRVRAVKLILQWVQTDIHLMDEKLKVDIKQFCENTLDKETTFGPKLSQDIQKELSRKDMWQIKVTPVLYNEIPVYEIFGSISDFILLHEDIVIASHLAHIHFDIYSKIQFSELVDQKWSKQNVNFFSPNVLALIDRIEKLSYWVATVILQQTKLKERTRVLTKMISICEKLREIHDFNGLLGVLNGLALGPVSRLKHTWNSISHKTSDLYNSMCSLADPTRSFNNLREEMKIYPMNRAMPCLAVFLGDLISIDQNADFVTAVHPKTGNPVTLVNVLKLKMVTNTIKTVIQANRTSVYDLERTEEPLYTFLFELMGMEISELQTCSLEREPRDSELKNIQ